MKHLFLNGGGIKGISYIGFMSKIYTLDIEFEEYHGVSIGSVFALFLLLEIEPEIIYNLISSIKIKISIDNLLQGKSTILENPIKSLLTHFIPEKVTFQELYNLTGKLFHVYTTNFETKQLKVFDTKNTPNTLVLDAILASCCLPIIFPIVKINGIEYIDGVFSEYTYPKDCLSVTLKSNNNQSNNLFNLITKVIRLAIPKKPEAKVIIELPDTAQSLNFKMLNNKSFINNLIVSGFQALES